MMYSAITPWTEWGRPWIPKNGQARVELNPNYSSKGSQRFQKNQKFFFVEIPFFCRTLNQAADLGKLSVFKGDYSVTLFDADGAILEETTVQIGDNCDLRLGLLVGYYFSLRKRSTTCRKKWYSTWEILFPGLFDTKFNLISTHAVML